MGSIYELTFFLALGLLAIVITIFVFAVSLLGRAIEAAAISEKESLARRKESNRKEMVTIRKEIQKAETEGQIPKGLTRKLKKLEKKDKKFEKEQSKIRKAPESLAVRGGVFYPCAFLIAALALNAGASYLSNTQNIHWAIAFSLWILSLAAVGYGIYRICKSLKVIQSVAVPSEEVVFKRETEAFKSALKEIEEGKKPKFELEFREEKPPFHVKAELQMTIKFALSLTQGDLARKPIVYFFAPSGFAFPGSQTWVQSKYVEEVIRGHITTQWEFDEIRTGITPVGELTLKVPSNKDEFTLRYRLTCEGFASGIKEFKVIVE